MVFFVLGFINEKLYFQLLWAHQSQYLLGCTSYLSIAGFMDETPRDYLCNLGPDGRRRDSGERPELCKGTVEFVASKEYMVCNT